MASTNEYNSRFNTESMMFGYSSSLAVEGDKLMMDPYEVNTKKKVFFCLTWGSIFWGGGISVCERRRKGGRGQEEKERKEKER